MSMSKMSKSIVTKVQLSVTKAWIKDSIKFASLSNQGWYRIQDKPSVTNPTIWTNPLMLLNAIRNRGISMSKVMFSTSVSVEPNTRNLTTKEGEGPKKQKLVRSPGFKKFYARLNARALEASWKPVPAVDKEPKAVGICTSTQANSVLTSSMSADVSKVEEKIENSSGQKPDQADKPKEGTKESLVGLGARQEKLLVDGVWLNWDTVGTGDHVVLLLPGIMGVIQDFGPVFAKMDKEKFTMVSWDPPGYGRSRPPNRDFSGIFYQRDGHLVVKLMDKLGYDKFSILGCSNGGITGVHIAAGYPGRINKLVTWGSHAFTDEQTVLFTKLMGDTNLWTPKMLQSAMAMYGREYLEQMLKDWHKGVSDFHQKGLDRVFRQELPKITCPTLVIHGEEDPILGVDHAEFLRDHIKNSKMYVMPDAKHNLHLKFTDQFLYLVENFLQDKEI